MLLPKQGKPLLQNIFMEFVCVIKRGQVKLGNNFHIHFVQIGKGNY